MTLGARLVLSATIASGVLAGRVANAGETLWAEHFDRTLDWGSPSRHEPVTIRRVFSLARDDSGGFLRAAHDAVKRSGYAPPPAVHYGRAFAEGAVPLTRACSFEWRWRVLKHPAAAKDPWDDLAASVYVVMRAPGIFAGGRGFKLGWLSRPGPVGTRQRGLIQIEVRHDAAGDEWRSERVDLCALYKRHYADPAGESIRYVGVVTDADDTNSESRADYADFRLGT